MTNSIRKLRRSGPLARFFRAAAVGAMAALLPLSAAGAADLAVIQDPPPAPAVLDSGWVLSVSAYGWASGINGRMRTLPPLPAVNVNIRFEEVLENFGGALMGVTELRNGRFILFGDFIFARIHPDKDIAVRGLGGTVKLDSITVTGLGAVGYRVFDDPRFFVDVFAGVRGFYADNELKLGIGPLPTLGYGKDQAWAVPAAGARLRVNFDQNWFMNAIAFAGATDTKSNYFWDTYAGITPSTSAIQPSPAIA